MPETNAGIVATRPTVVVFRSSRPGAERRPSSGGGACARAREGAKMTVRCVVVVVVELDLQYRGLGAASAGRISIRSVRLDVEFGRHDPNSIRAF
eukprot:8966190-Pyramimonas_sp.AAC.1